MVKDCTRFPSRTIASSEPKPAFDPYTGERLSNASSSQNFCFNPYSGEPYAHISEVKDEPMVEPDSLFNPSAATPSTASPLQNKLSF